MALDKVMRLIDCLEVIRERTTRERLQCMYIKHVHRTRRGESTGYIQQALTMYVCEVVSRWYVQSMFRS